MMNMGSTDRILRLVIGLGLLVLVLFFGLGGAGWLRWLLIAVGVVMAATAAIGTCPAYRLFGIKTCRRD